MSLGVSVSFVEFPPEDMPSFNDTVDNIEQQFCVKQNAYCDVSLCIKDYWSSII